MATWHYTNTSISPTRIAFPNNWASGQDTLLPAGSTLTFNSAGDQGMTLYDAISWTVSGRGKVREVAQPGHGPT